jgi:hypothetical protein
MFSQKVVMFHFSLKCYENRSTETSAVDKSLRMDLTELEKKMLDTQHVIEVRGKVM